MKSSLHEKMSAIPLEFSQIFYFLALSSVSQVHPVVELNQRRDDFFWHTLCLFLLELFYNLGAMVFLCVCFSQNSSPSWRFYNWRWLDVSVFGGGGWPVMPSFLSSTQPQLLWDTPILSSILLSYMRSLQNGKGSGSMEKCIITQISVLSFQTCFRLTSVPIYYLHTKF